jgi:hypothetical protein
MRGHGHAYHQQLGHGNAPMPDMPPQMGAPGVQGMQPFTGMMMPGMEDRWSLRWARDCTVYRAV